MIDIKEQDLLDIIFELTHTKDEEGKDIPNFCFASDISVDLKSNDEDVAKTAIKNGYSIYKVFPGETMLGGLVIVAEGANIEPVEKMYKEFYGEVPEIIKMELNDDEQLVEIDDNLSEALSNHRDLEKTIRDVVSKYKEEADSKLGILETDAGTFVHEYGDEVDPIDFSTFQYHGEGEQENEYGERSPLITFLLTGGLNGNGKWEDYLENIAKLIKELKSETGLNIEIQTLDSDIPDDVWTAEVLMYKKSDDNLDESLNRLFEALNEARNKRPKITTRDPNAAAMWGRTRHRVELPKKGKGSFKRHDKHRVNEGVFVTPPKEDQESFLDLLRNLGYIIEYTRESSYNGDDDDGKDIHIQIYSEREWPHTEEESSQEIYNKNKDELDSEIRKLADVISDFDDELNNKYHITYSIGFGGFTARGVDCTGRISAGIDMRPMYLDPEAIDIDLGEDLYLDIHDLEDMIYPDDEYNNKFITKAESLGAEMDIYDRLSSQRLDSMWYNDLVATITYKGIVLDIYAVGEVHAVLDGEYDLWNSNDFEEHYLYTDAAVREADNNGRIDWDSNNWFNYRIYLDEDIPGLPVSDSMVYADELGYDLPCNIEDALDIEAYINDGVFEEYIRYLEEDGYEVPIKESKKKRKVKKGVAGWFIHPNVEKDIQHFNHVMNAPDAPSTITAPAGLGEDLDLEVADRYVWEFDTANKFVRSRWDADRQKPIYYAHIPEVCIKVTRDDYKTNKLLVRPKNKEIRKGVEQFFSKHPNAKYCVISCKDISRSEYGRYVNAYRVLDESLNESQEDYYVLSDGKNPKNSQIFSTISDLDSFIAELEKNKTDSYWELLHYVDGEPEVIWKTNKTESIDKDNKKSYNIPARGDSMEEKEERNQPLTEEAKNDIISFMDSIMSEYKDVMDELGK